MSYLCLCLCLCASENQPLFTGHPKRFILTIKTSVISSKLDWFKHFFSCNRFLVSKLPFYEIFTRNLSLQHDKMYYVYCEVFFDWNPTQVRIVDLFFCQAKSILPFEWMMRVKYNWRYHFFDEDWFYSVTLNKHFANDLQTHSESETCPCKNIKFMC